ncbi:hypothetical protein HMPREF9332_01092 [Alloprevotella rava F0323]|uniref:Tetratricopeptide repeat protein n=1 Tax=Alloprevotella rava F0323 TaxID=679199 RepID=G5GBZ1_9BACT|nr:hypothetical protein [Alloprevotella rava]EHG22887.1 hypothetical protein HMPREF9332_01092 [Alloprevotella rava F0323]
MQSKPLVYLALAATVGLTSCSKMGPLSSENFAVAPSPLEAVDNQVPVAISGRFPEKYMKKNAVVKITPVLRFQGGKSTGAGDIFQGEKVQGNHQEISYLLGGNYNLRTTFPFRDEMLRSELYVTFDATVGKKKVNIPEVKVADGVLATSTLLCRTAASANAALGEDKFQYTIEQKQEAQIKYLIQQARIRTSELQSASVKDFVQTLRNIKADDKRLELENVEVSSYASPDGGEKLNTKLAQSRDNASGSYVKNQLKKINLEGEVNSRYTAQDWEGFQELVSQSNIQDKEVILRVLSMYQDPEQREQQIKNLSAGFRELADEVLPELRRSRLTINYLIVGRTDDEIQQQLQTDASKLSIEELLYAATLADDPAEKENIYTTADRLFPADYRAVNNLGVLAYEKGNLTAAKDFFSKAAKKNEQAAEPKANLALLALTEGDSKTSEDYLGQAATARNYGEVLGNLALARGQYVQAARQLQGVNTNSAALAQILNKNYTEARTTLSRVAQPDATTAYLKAILAARTRQAADVVPNLEQAFKLDSTFKARAAKDLEFANYFNTADFQNITK